MFEIVFVHYGVKGCGNRDVWKKFDNLEDARNALPDAIDAAAKIENVAGVALDQVLVCEKRLIRYKQYEYKEKPVK